VQKSLPANPEKLSSVAAPDVLGKFLGAQEAGASGLRPRTLANQAQKARLAPRSVLWALLEIQIFGMKCKAHGAQQPQCTWVHEDCEHRATQQFARKMNL